MILGNPNTTTTSQIKKMQKEKAANISFLQVKPIAMTAKEVIPKNMKQITTAFVRGIKKRLTSNPPANEPMDSHEKAEATEFSRFPEACEAAPEMENVAPIIAPIGVATTKANKPTKLNGVQNPAVVPRIPRPALMVQMIGMRERMNTSNNAPKALTPSFIFVANPLTMIAPKAMPINHPANNIPIVNSLPKKDAKNSRIKILWAPMEMHPKMKMTAFNEMRFAIILRIPYLPQHFPQYKPF